MNSLRSHLIYLIVSLTLCCFIIHPSSYSKTPSSKSPKSAASSLSTPAPTPSPAPIPNHLATGSRYGVISVSPTLNKTAFHWLQQKGTVWDSALAVVFEMLLKAPHIVSLTGDMAIMTYQRGGTPQFYWLGNFDLADPSPAHVFPYSQWPQMLLDQHKRFSKFPLDQIASMSLLTSRQGWTIPDEFWSTLKPLTSLPAFEFYKSHKTKSQSKKLKSEKLHSLLTRLSQYQSLYPAQKEAQKPFLDAQTQALPASVRSSFAKTHAFIFPPQDRMVFTPTIPLDSEKLYALDERLLAALQHNIDTLWNFKDLIPSNLSGYFKKVRTEKIDTPYDNTFSLTLFDSYGSVLILNMGIPDIRNAYRDQATHTLAHTSFSRHQDRVWSLSPYVIHQHGKGIRVAIAPQITNLNGFIHSFPLILFQVLKQGRSFAESLDMPQFFVASPEKLYLTTPDPFFSKTFATTQPLTMLNTLTGLEVWLNFVVGFTPPKSKVKPLLF